MNCGLALVGVISMVDAIERAVKELSNRLTLRQFRWIVGYKIGCSNQGVDLCVRFSALMRFCDQMFSDAIRCFGFGGRSLVH